MGNLKLKQKYASGTDGVVGPTRKEAADLMRVYNKTNKNNPNIIGAIDDTDFNVKGNTLKTLTTSNKIKIPTIVNSDSFAGPSNEELQTGRIRENAETARKTYETRISAEAARSKYEKDQVDYDNAIKSGVPKSLNTIKFKPEAVQKALEKQYGGPVSTEKNPILYKEESKEKQKNPYISFKQMSAADQKAYRAGMASGLDFKVGGRDYKAATKEEQAVSARMANKNIKPDTFWKDVYESRKPTIGKNFGTIKTPFTGARENINKLKSNNKQIPTKTLPGPLKQMLGSNPSMQAIIGAITMISKLKHNKTK